MSYNRVTITHPDGHEETFPTRISEEGFVNWLRDRAALGAQGKPDRPPDVDTATLRAWLMHPGEEDHPHFRDRQTPRDVSVPLAAVSLRAGSIRTRWLLNEGGFGYQVAVILDDLTSGEVIEAFARDYATGEEDELEEALLELVADMPDGVTALVSTPSDYELAKSEAALARADLDRGFISPLPPSEAIQ